LGRSSAKSLPGLGMDNVFRRVFVTTFFSCLRWFPLRGWNALSMERHHNVLDVIGRNDTTTTNNRTKVIPEHPFVENLRDLRGSDPELSGHI